MVRLPRDEISYKKLYGALDLDRPLNIGWGGDSEMGEAVVVDETGVVDCLEDSLDSSEELDEFDCAFAAKSGISEGELKVVLARLSKAFDAFIKGKLDLVEPLAPSGPCDICGEEAAEPAGYSVVDSSQESEEDTENSESGGRMLCCNGCGVTVHAECYGAVDPCIPFWFCTRCIFLNDPAVTTVLSGEENSQSEQNPAKDQQSPSHTHSSPVSGTDGTPNACSIRCNQMVRVEPPTCQFCSQRNGIFKRTDKLQWVHAVCAAIHPRLSFANCNTKDPVDTTAFKRRTGVCGHCQAQSEYLVKCAVYGCKNAYHASCAAVALLCDLNNRHIYCPEHDFSRPQLISLQAATKERMNFPDAENPLLLRFPRPLQKPRLTLFAEAVLSDPCWFQPALDAGKAGAYWAQKQQAFGYALRDVFKFSNYVNRHYWSLK